MLTPPSTKAPQRWNRRIEQPSDTVYQFSVPALGNIFWRWFYPEKPGREPLASAPDYTGECWPYLAGPERGDKQYAGWPANIDFDDLDGRRPVAWLPDLDLSAVPDAVVQIVDQGSGEVVKITRARETSYSPGVFKTDGVYTLRAGDPEHNRWWTAKDLKPGARGEKKLRVEPR